MVDFTSNPLPQEGGAECVLCSKSMDELQGAFQKGVALLDEGNTALLLTPPDSPEFDILLGLFEAAYVKLLDLDAHITVLEDRRGF